MKHALAAGLFTMAIFACGGGGTSSDALNPEELQTAVVAAMAGVDSYRTELDFGTGAPLVVEYAKPNSYRVFWAGRDIDKGTEIVVGGSEVLYVGDRFFLRQCRGPNVGCEPWKSSGRGTGVILGTTPSYFPQWPLLAIQLAQDLRSPGRDRIIGSVNHVRAILENANRLQTAAGQTSYGHECTAGGTPVPIIDRNGPPPVGTVECHEVTYEAFLAQQPEVSFYDDHPAKIEAWIDPQTSLVERIEITGITAHTSGIADSGSDVTLTFEYSDFNNVTIEAPR